MLVHIKDAASCAHYPTTRCATAALRGLVLHRSIYRSMSKVLARPPSACSTTRDGAQRGRRCIRPPLHYRFITASLPLHYRNSTRLDVHSTTHRCVEWPCLTEAKSVPLTRDCSEDVDKRRFEEDRRVRERGRERTCKSRCRDAKAYRNHR
jgi:hypothetical protein